MQLDGSLDSRGLNLRRRVLFQHTRALLARNVFSIAVSTLIAACFQSCHERRINSTMICTIDSRAPTRWHKVQLILAAASLASLACEHRRGPQDPPLLPLLPSKQAQARPTLMLPIDAARVPGEASPEVRRAIGRGADYRPALDPDEKLFTTLRDSMLARRTFAWRLVDRLLEPQTIKFGEHSVSVPLWHTWYEGIAANREVQERTTLYFARLKACMADPACKKSQAEIASETLGPSDTVDLLATLDPKTFTSRLRQAANPSAPTPAGFGDGFTLFSPAFLRHMLVVAQGVEKCDVRVAWDAPPPSDKQFSPCVEEFPREAVMVKATWHRIGAAAKVPDHDTGAESIAAAISTGQWIAPSWVTPNADELYTVGTTDGAIYGLTGIHFSTKDVREWLWVSLWWSSDPSADFGEDRPGDLKNVTGVWSNYKMCVTSAFNEGDPRPWEHYIDSHPSLARVLESSHRELRDDAPDEASVTTWCSNPNIEFQPGNARTNCVGCHQYAYTWNVGRGAQTSFDDTYDPNQGAEYPQFGRARRRHNFTADFAWSFGLEFQPSVVDARQAAGVEW